MEQVGASAEPRCPSLWLPFSSDHFTSPISRCLILRVLDKFNPYINSLGKDLALNFIVYNDVRGMLADVVDAFYCYAIYF